MKEVEESIKEELRQHFDGEVQLEVPDNPEHGDYATNACMRYGKKKGVNPRELAEKVLDKINIENIKCVEDAEVAGPGFINFFLDRKRYAEKLLQTISDEGNRYGSSDIGDGKKIVIDYSAPNIGKPMHVGHLRSTIIGDSIRKILEFAGYDCIGINHLGDMGTQFGKLIYSYRHWGDEEKLKDSPIQHLLDLYVRFHEEAEKDEGLEDEARKWSKKLEDDDEEAVQLWKEFTRYSKSELKKIYRRLNVDFDSWKGERFYKDRARKVVEEALEKDLAKKEEDASVIVETGGEGEPPFLIMRKDGGTLYSTRDLAAIKYRKEKYDFYRALYVVSSAQNMHFKHLFETAEKLGYAKRDELVHVNFGLMSLPEGSMSTREGKVVLLKDLLDTARDEALDAIREKNPGLENKEEVAEKIGVGAIKYMDLSKKRTTDVKFSWDNALNFEGSSGPYLQYSYARACGIIDEVDSESRIDAEDLEDIEFQLIRRMGRFHEAIETASRNYEPHRIANYLNDLCEVFNEFYHKCRVKDSNREERRKRIVETFRTVLGNGLDLLKIPRLEEM